MLQSLFKSSVVPGLITAALLVTFCWTQASSKRKGDKIKQAVILPGTLPILGNAIELAVNAPRMHDWLADHFAATNGEAFIVRLPGKDDMMFIAKPEHLEAVLKTQFDNFPKSEYIHDVFYDVLGDGIVLTNGETWKRQRNVVVGLFSARALREHMTPIIQKYTLQLVEILTSAATTNTPLDVFELLNRYTFDVFGEIGFGAKMGSMDGAYQPLAQAIDEAQFLSGKRFKQPVWYWKLRRWFNLGDEKKLKENVRLIDEYLMGIIADAVERRHRRIEEQEIGRPVTLADKDIVSIVLDKMESNGIPVNPVEVRNIAIASIIAGRDTTAGCIGWLFHLFSQNPEAEAKLRTELQAKIPKLTFDKYYTPSVTDVNSVPYLEACVREVLRLYPSGPLITTHCIKDTVLPDGTFVPASTDIGIALFSCGRLTSVWGDDALKFNPDRFLDSDTGEIIPMTSTKFAPFSAGPRICVGQTLALLEAKIVVASIVARFEMTPLPGQHVTYTQGIALGMMDPLMMLLKPVVCEHQNDSCTL
ncbi:cytochrome P450, putative [Plasmopara halstedii]|uniref:Cytochrome P450, putative n=1 Tax=Plasmopara halstedii TaxID=4781 RepID=A0A0P1AIW0_PLAHL|nr:cytochrome P450, putative [Plasmopara halstedii]CEG40452.1 cytochrome P450, putative [Plasmopara halstedii]|eukprot:XP_024576821.1 cytochrome P450, putative [Plasmopara halstedii]